LRSIEAAVSLIRRDSTPLDAVVTNLDSDSQPAADAVFEPVGAFAFVNRLCDLLRRNSGRIVMATTADATRAFDSSALYAQSTTAIRLYVKEFARRLAVRGVAANAVDASRQTWNRRRWYSLTRLFTRSAAQGAATVVLLAASPQVERISGEFWIEGTVAERGSSVDEEVLARRLWDESEEMISGRTRVEQPA
jgi:NAD(P)-dependent dehydrogenase (short-subunit alcohol dehydrogenase family)